LIHSPGVTAVLSQSPLAADQELIKIVFSKESLNF